MHDHHHGSGSPWMFWLIMALCAILVAGIVYGALLLNGKPH